jgi:hypothetical protein
MTVNSGLRWIHLGVPQGILGGVIGILFTGLLQARGHLPGGLIVTLLGASVLGGIAWGINYALMRSGDKLGNSVYAPSGDTTKYIPTFSHIEAMEIRGDFAGAERAWDDACLEHPSNALVLVKSADFQLRLKKDPAAALERFRRVREMQGASSELIRYASQKVIDIHLGPLADEGRALVELRRMVELYPGTREAADAREVIAKIKEGRRIE